MDKNDLILILLKNNDHLILSKLCLIDSTVSPVYSFKRKCKLLTCNTHYTIDIIVYLYFIYSFPHIRLTMLKLITVCYYLANKYSN